MKRFKRIYRLVSAVLAIALLASCAGLKKLEKGQYILTKNHVIVTNSKTYPSSDLTPYIKQSETPSLLGIRSPFEAPVVMDPGTVEASRDGMLRHLEYKGYYNSSVDTIVSRRGRNKAIVNYLVKLGKQYPIKKLEYFVVDSAIRRIMAADSASRTIHTGDILSEQSLEAEATRIASLLRGKGYYSFTKNYMFNFADTLSVPDSALLRVELRNYTRNESPSMARSLKQHTIRYVSYELPRNMNVRLGFLEELNLLKSGMTYSEELINTTYQRFAGNRCFNTVNISLNPVDTTGDVDCLIALTPSRPQNFEVNMDASTNSAGLIGITPSFTYNNFNLFRGGEVLSLGFRGNFQFKFNDNTHSNEFAITAGLKFPKLLLLPFIKSTTPNLPSTDFSLAYNYQNRPEYTRNIFSGSYGYSWSSARNLRFSVKVPNVSIIKIFNIDPDFFSNLRSSYLQYLYQNHFDLGTNASVYYTTNTNVNPTVSYFYIRGDLASSGLGISAFNALLEENRRGQRIIWGIPYSQYVRTQITAVGTLRFGRGNKMALAARFLGGVGHAYGNSLFSMPMEQMFYAGGASSMRGWQSRCIGPGLSQLDKSFAIYNQVGEMRLETNLEFRFPLVWKINGAIFSDIGNIWNLPKKDGFTDEEYDLSVFSLSNLPKSIGMNWGLGARLDFGLLLIRVDWGIKGYDPALQRWLVPREWFSSNGSAIHLGIGYPF